MPTLLRLALIVAVVAGLVYGGMVALVAFVDPEPREISVPIPPSKLPR